MTGPLDDAVDPDDLRDHAGRGLLVRRPRRLGRSLYRSARSSPSRRCRRGSSRRSAACSRSRSTSRARSRSSTGSSSTSTCPSTSSRARATLEHGARRRAPRATSGSATATATYALDGRRHRIPAGTTTAIVGETGAGKTTLGYLVSRLYDPTQGAVTIDGVDIRELTFESLAATVGVVSQETYLFHATVRENLRFAQAGRDRRGGRGGGARRPDPQPDLVAARGLRDGRRRARLPLLGRREAADRDRAGDPAQPADPRARRGDLRARHADRARRAGGARTARRRPHDDRDRPPALDDPRRRPDRRPRRRPGRRARHLRRARRPRRRFAALAARDADTARARPRRDRLTRRGRSSAIPQLRRRAPPRTGFASV